MTPQGHPVRRVLSMVQLAGFALDEGWSHFAVGNRYDASLFQVNGPPVEPGCNHTP